MTQVESRITPVLVEILRNGVIAVTEEMKTNLMRTAYNMIIYEALDFTVGLFTATGETVSISLGLPTFIRGMAETIRAKLKHFGKDGIEPGDILLTNDAYITGSHLNHMTFSLPIFHEGELIGFSCCMAHWQDVGGTLGGITTDIFSEGLQVPIVKYSKKGIVNQDLVDIIRMNVRIPERAMGDLRAQITALKSGEKRFLELVKRYGRDEVLGSIAAIMDQSEAAARARTRAIPDGIYVAESFMDDDGMSVGASVPIKVRVTVAGDEMTIDLTDVSKQVRGFYNSGITTGHACAQVAFKCLTSPTDYPINEGLVPQSEGDRAAGPRDQRDAPRADALVDDLSDDRDRYGVQGAGRCHPVSGHRGAPCRSLRVAGTRRRSQGREILPRPYGAARRRLGRETLRGRRVGHGLHQ